jgi:hypothetical protein
MMRSFLDNPQHWQDRAEETRTKAELLWHDEKEKQRMLRIAAEYDRLAERAVQWQQGSRG